MLLVPTNIYIICDSKGVLAFGPEYYNITDLRVCTFLSLSLSLSLSIPFVVVLLTMMIMSWLMQAFETNFDLQQAQITDVGSTGSCSECALYGTSSFFGAALHKVVSLLLELFIFTQRAIWTHNTSQPWLKAFQHYLTGSHRATSNNGRAVLRMTLSSLRLYSNKLE